MSVRAEVWSTPYRDKGHRRRTWHYKVMNSAGETVLYDNTGHFDVIMRTALIEVEALRHMETAGHTLKPYKETR